MRCFTLISSIFSSERIISVSSDGVQGALNLRAIHFFFLQVVVLWWVCTFFTKLIIWGYFDSPSRAHVMCLSMNSTSSLSSLSVNAYVQFLVQYMDFFLTHFIPLVSFYTPWKHQKTSGFLFSGGIERAQWQKIIWIISVQWNSAAEQVKKKVYTPNCLISARTSKSILWKYWGVTLFLKGKKIWSSDTIFLILSWLTNWPILISL